MQISTTSFYWRPDIEPMRRYTFIVEHPEITNNCQMSVVSSTIKEAKHLVKSRNIQRSYIADKIPMDLFRYKLILVIDLAADINENNIT